MDKKGGDFFGQNFLSRPSEPLHLRLKDFYALQRQMDPASPLGTFILYSLCMMDALSGQQVGPESW